jgi:uncharacterized protein (TIGR02145 family)
MADTSPDVSLTVLNDADQSRIIYVGVTTDLDVSLLNEGDPIKLNSSGAASSLEIFMPEFFELDKLKDMSITQTGWTFSVNSADVSLMLTYTGADGASWDADHPIAFKIKNVESDDQPTTKQVQVNFQNMTGNVPLQVLAPLSLLNPPKHGNASLKDVLQVSLDSQGSVYVSQKGDPLQNTLFLNFKNTGATALYSGQAMWQTAPRVTVTFLYGNTSGTLAPGDDKGTPPVGSAWNIIGSIYSEQNNSWNLANPSTTGDDPHPQWQLAPANTNQGIIGSDANSNITFAFSKIISLTPPGHTQIVVLFTGFMKDEKTHYDDEVFVIDIVKQNPPPTRGLLTFFGDSPVFQVTSPTQPININLRWAMFDVAYVNLICSFPDSPVISVKYPLFTPLAYDKYSLVIPGITDSLPIFITLQSFDGNGSYLNSMQFTVFINAMMFVDARDEHVYPIVLLNNQLWMAHNLQHDDSKESYIYNNQHSNQQQYGNLYTAKADSSNMPSTGWRLPSKSDWEGLFALYGSPGAAYQALLDGGAAGFNAQLGGFRSDCGAYSDFTSHGYYRTSSGDIYAGFSSKTKSTSVAATFPETFAISIRYVKDL